MEETKGCWQKCLKCDKEPKFYANPMKFHKLCIDHSNVQNENLTCGDCQISVNVYNCTRISCDICECTDDINILCCGHNLCNLCYRNKCKFCFSVCFRCEIAIEKNNYKNHQFLPCGHNFCNTCMTLVGNQCIFCTETICNICKTSKSSLYLNNCPDCIGPCQNCTKVSRTKYKKLCNHTYCLYCCTDSKTNCITCGLDACHKCLIQSSCKDTSHFICKECSSYRLRCLVCYPDQICTKCCSFSATRLCNNEHLNCKECIPKFNEQIFCASCNYICCACEKFFELKDLGELTQRNCGHYICNICLQYNPQRACTKCPSTRSKCYNCKREVSFEGEEKGSMDRSLNRNKSGNLSVQECRNCKKKICIACGGSIGFWRVHTCDINFKD